MVGSSGTETGFLMAAFQPIATPLQQNGWFQWNREWGKGGEAQEASQVEMKLDYLRLCNRALDNPGFIMHFVFGDQPRGPRDTPNLWAAKALRLRPWALELLTAPHLLANQCPPEGSVSLP